MATKLSARPSRREHLVPDRPTEPTIAAKGASDAGIETSHAARKCTSVGTQTTGKDSHSVSATERSLPCPPYQGNPIQVSAPSAKMHAQLGRDPMEPTANSDVPSAPHPQATNTCTTADLVSVAESMPIQRLQQMLEHCVNQQTVLRERSLQAQRDIQKLHRHHGEIRQWCEQRVQQTAELSGSRPADSDAATAPVSLPLLLSEAYEDMEATGQARIQRLINDLEVSQSKDDAEVEQFKQLERLTQTHIMIKQASGSYSPGLLRRWHDMASNEHI